jgi:23S rRNA (uracil1939-C5)-methyltransferase
MSTQDITAVPGQEQPEQNPSDLEWRQGRLIELEIEDLSLTGDGVGRWGPQQRVVFVPDTVPGDRITVRLLHVKPNFAQGQLQDLIHASADRVRPACMVADKCGGCQWQPVDYAYQLTAKRNQVLQALERIGQFQAPPVDPVLAAPSPLGYRNKVTYPLGLKQSRGQIKVQAGYYRKGSHRLVNLNQCPVQDPRLNPLLAQIKQDIQQQGWKIYNEQHHRGQLRHLCLRIGRNTGEILLTLVSCEETLPNLDTQAQAWMARYPGLVGVCVNVNADRTNRVMGDRTHCVLGRPYLEEQFAGLRFQIRADTFFQVHTEQAEALLTVIVEQLQLQGQETVIDAYCGIGTITLPLAQHVNQIVGLELQAAAVEQARVNAKLNQITNATFTVGKVTEQLAQLSMLPTIVCLDPPRKGCAPEVLDQLVQMRPHQIVYVSCHPATLARDLRYLCQQGDYQLVRVQPADFFPQTAHVECAAFLETRS